MVSQGHHGTADGSAIPHRALYGQSLGNTEAKSKSCSDPLGDIDTCHLYCLLLHLTLDLISSWTVPFQNAALTLSPPGSEPHCSHHRAAATASPVACAC